MSIIRTLKQKYKQLLAWAKKHKKLAALYAALTIIILGGLGTIAYTIFFNRDADGSLPPLLGIFQEKKPVEKFYSPLTGNPVKSKAEQTKPITAIMIENSPDARPQSGLKQAEVVYEAIAEGGITRFLALYQQEKPQLIGPVRSLRPYYIDWLAPYQPSVAHVGGSLYALREIRNGKYRDIDQFYNSNTYWRASDRYAPHNVYTNFKNLDNLNKQKKFTQSDAKPLPREDSTKADKTDATNVSINVSSGTYNSQYTYNPKSNNYTRHQGGAVHKDREKGDITPKVVVALKTNMSTVMEDGYRENIQTTGSGDAYIFQNGTVRGVKWHKKNKSEQFFFTNKNGDRVNLARGTTWITAVPNGQGSVAWK